MFATFRPSRPRPLTVFVLAAMAVLTSPGSAAAADTTIDFEDRPIGERITTQYAAQGITFGRSPRGVNGYRDPTFEIVQAGLLGKGLEVFPSGQACGGVEFPCTEEHYRTDARLDFARQRVKVTIRANRSKYSRMPITLRALTSTGAVIDVASAPFSATVPFDLQVTSPIQNIVFIEIKGAVVIDNIVYDRPASPPPPDFALAPSFPPLEGAGIRLKNGETKTVNVLVSRFNNSVGPLTFTATGAPAGVSIPTKSSSAPDGSTVPITVSAAVSAPAGSKTVTVAATGPAAAAPAGTKRTFSFPVTVFRDYDLRVTGIEVTQGIQRELIRCFNPADCRSNVSLPQRNPAAPKAAVPYNGFFPRFYRSATMVANKRTVARVFANVKAPPAPNAIAVRGVQAQLRGFRGGKELKQSPLSPQNGAKVLTTRNVTKGGGQGWVTFSDRADAEQGFAFVLPDSWTKGNVTLRAELIPPSDPFDSLDPAECDSATCKADNTFTLSGIPFFKTGSFKVAHAWLPRNGEATPSTGLRGLMSDAELWTPVADGALEYGNSYYRTINIEDAIKDNPGSGGQLRNNESDAVTAARKEAMYDAKAKLEDTAADYPGCSWADFCADVIQGHFSGAWYRGGVSDSDFPGGVNVGPVTRIPTLSHEIAHNLGRDHSGRDCPGLEGQSAENWPNDDRGLIHGVGLDTRPGSGQGYSAPFRTVAPASLLGVMPGPPSAGRQRWEYFDQMSYCREQDDTRWASDLGLERFFVPTTVGTLAGIDLVPPSLTPHLIAKASVASTAAARSARRRAPVRDLLMVSGRFTPGLGGKVTLVKERRTEFLSRSSDPRYRLIVRNRGGAVIANIPMHAVRYEPDPQVQLSAQVPVKSAGSVEITRDGALIAKRERTATAPKVRVTSPRKGSRVGRKKGTAVRWRATDKEGGRLRAKIDYSFNDGRTWTTIYSGPNTGRAVVPSDILSGSERARLRLRVSDGFNEGQATSGRLRAAGRPPTIRILSPGLREKIARDGFLALAVEARDDRQRKMSGKQLRWYSRGRLIARGKRASVTALPAGRRRITVVARSGKRQSRSSVVVRVVRTPPRFLALSGPRALSRRARSVKVKVRANLPSTLAAGKKRFKVGRRTKTLRIRVKRGSKPLAIKLRLRSGGITTRGVLRFER